ncbi:MAG: PAS domain S-box protein [Desulfobacterales bacterium]|nr:PAS domain S-box protein [Desulfobacterales bacterium]
MAEKSSNKELEKKIKALEKQTAEDRLWLENLKESEDRYRRIISSLPLASFEIDIRSKKFTHVNDIMCEYSGYTREELLSMTPHDLSIQDSNTLTLKDKIKARKKIEFPESAEYSLKKKDGKELRATINTQIVYKDQNPFKAICAAQDISGITSRLQIEKALRESEEKYRSMMEALNDPIFITDKEFRISYMNSAMIKRTGYEAIGEICFKIVHGLNEKCPWCVYHVIKEWEQAETEVISPLDGLTYSVTNSPIIHRDGTVYKIAILRDVTKTKLLQNQLARSERLAVTGQLAASIAHEINSPLQAVTVMLTSLQNENKGNIKLTEDLLLLKDAYGSIRDTVKNLLDLNRRGKEQKEQTNINEIIQKTVDLMRSHLRKNKVKVNLDLFPDLPKIFASPQQLNHCFLNLINNAVDAIMEEANTSDIFEDRTLIIGEVKIRSRKDNKNIVITITDTGPGIDDKDLKHIFDPFYTKKKMGFGVGLSICNRIIEEHSGIITADNIEDAGAIFTISLPITNKEKTQEKGR